MAKHPWRSASASFACVCACQRLMEDRGSFQAVLLPQLRSPKHPRSPPFYPLLFGCCHLRTGLNALSSLDNWATDRRTVSCLTFRFPFVFLEQMKCDPIFPEISSLKSYQRGKLLRDRRNQALVAPRGGIVLQLLLLVAGSLPTFPGLRAALRSRYRGSQCQTPCCMEGKSPVPGGVCV